MYWLGIVDQRLAWFTGKSSFFQVVWSSFLNSAFVSISLFLPAILIWPSWCVFPPVPPAEDAHILTHPPHSFFTSLTSFSQEPLKIIAVHWEALLIWSRPAQGESELYFLQNTDQRGKKGHILKGLLRPICVRFFLFLPFCVLVQFFLFFLHFVLPVFSCHSDFWLCSFSNVSAFSEYYDQF